MTQSLSPHEFAARIHGRLGLFSGPGHSLYPGVIRQTVERLARHTSAVTQDASLTTALHHLVAAGVPESTLQQALAECTDNASPNPDLSASSSVNWLAVASISLDGHLESRLRSRMAEKAFGRDVATIADANSPPPPDALPFIRLLGQASIGRTVPALAQYRSQRERIWGRLLKIFIDRLRGAPVLCLGVEELPDIFLDSIAKLTAFPEAARVHLAFPADSALPNSRALTDMIGSDQITLVHGPIGEMCRALSSTPSRYNPEVVPRSTVALRRIGVVVDPHQGVDARERNRLLDILFSPSHLSWEPYIVDLDFERDAATELVQLIQDAANLGKSEAYAIILHGAASTGKTVLLRRCALELARRGHTAYWIRPFAIETSTSGLFDAMRTLRDISKGKTIVVFLDDPATAGGIPPRDVAAAAKAADLRCVLVVGIRSSDWVTSGPDLLPGITHYGVHTLSDTLSAQEIGRLPDYLIRLGIAASADDAKQHVCTASHQDRTRVADTLSVLYWLLPKTRAAIAASIHEEFARLSDRAAFTRLIQGALAIDSGVLQDAYARIAASHHHGVPVPIEVLVSSLEIDYSDWLDLEKSNQGFGLFYSSETNDPTDTITYHCRNDVVCRMIIDRLNGTPTSREGEVRELNRLLRGCVGTQPAYREFAVRLLVSNARSGKLDSHDLLQLFQTAIDSLPYHDRTLSHHYGITLRKAGQYAEAVQVLEQTLGAPAFPYARKLEPDEHIHTSAAATYVDGFASGFFPRDEAQEAALRHLSKARSETFFNPHAVHSQARLLTKLSENSPSDATHERAELRTRALADLDQALFCLPSESRDQRDMLLEAQAKLASSLSPPDAEQIATKLWAEHHNQYGFALLVRQAYHGARQDGGRGRHFQVAWRVADAKLSLVRESCEEPLPELLEACLHLYYQWRVHRIWEDSAATSMEVDWELLQQLCIGVARRDRLRSDPLNRYVLAVSQAHQGKWTEALGIFAALRGCRGSREVLFADRDWLIDANTGGPRRIQGTVKQAPSGLMLYSADLGIDFHVDRRTQWARPGEIEHAFVCFSFAGPKAVKPRRPAR